MSAEIRPLDGFLSNQNQTPNGTTLEFEAILDYLRRHQECDLTGYKRSTLMRRFRHRMQTINIDSYQSYLTYLENHPDEYRGLLNDVLINFTSFFRDREAWDYLAIDIIPRILAGKQSNDTIRVWSAGCATGQEIYSLLILLAEALGIEACLERVQCYATDADEIVLKQARQATYTDVDMIGISPDWCSKYFEHTEKGDVFHPALRRRVIFGHHDLIKDAPMSKIDLLICRNVLIYFQLEAQTTILVRFHFALKNTGFMFLGKSEALTSRRQIFTPVNLKQRVYAKGIDLDLEDHLSITSKSREKWLDKGLRNSEKIDIAANRSYFWQTVFETNPVAQCAVDPQGCLISANEQANLLFDLTPEDHNRSFQDLEPGKILVAQVSVKFVYRHHCPVKFRNIQWVTPQATKHFDVTIAPIISPTRQLLGIIVTFLDTSPELS
jgi:two-component system, chemotaxis family, CheB/CheR fusion protein